jgi:hypothetical protein
MWPLKSFGTTDAPASPSDWLHRQFNRLDAEFRMPPALQIGLVAGQEN